MRPSVLRCPKGVDFRPMAFVAHERVVSRHGAIVVEPQDLCRAGSSDLARPSPRIAAGGHVDLAVAPEDDSAVET